MSLTLVDTNVLLDLVTNDPRWAQWSIRQLDAAALKGKLAVNAVIYSELSVRFGRIESLDAFLRDASLELAEIPRAALFLAGKVFARYRRSGGVRTGVLPDFFIGAHAAVLDLPLLTRDSRRYTTYFPNLMVVAP